MKAEEYRERRVELAGWPVNVTTWRLGTVYHAQADNVSPGACLARAEGATREEAERQVLSRAGELLATTRRRSA